MSLYKSFVRKLRCHGNSLCRGQWYPEGFKREWETPFAYSPPCPEGSAWLFLGASQGSCPTDLDGGSDFSHMESEFHSFHCPRLIKITLWGERPFWRCQGLIQPSNEICLLGRPLPCVSVLPSSLWGQMVLCPSGASDYQPALSRGCYHVLLSSPPDAGLDSPWETRSLMSERPTFPLTLRKIPEAKMRARWTGCRTTLFEANEGTAALPWQKDESGDRDSGRGGQGLLMSQSRWTVSDVTRVTAHVTPGLSTSTSLSLWLWSPRGRKWEDSWRCPRAYGQGNKITRWGLLYITVQLTKWL